MEAILKFDLTNPDDAEDFKKYNQAPVYDYVLWKYLTELRKKIKYTNENMSQMEEARDMLLEIIKENNLDIEF